VPSFPRTPFSALGILPPLRSGQLFLTKPNTSCTIEVPASLRSENRSPSARNAVRVPFGISVRLRRNPQQGVVNVLSGAPYGYRYVKKSDHSVAYYEVIEHETQAVRMVFETYTRRHLSIHAIARLSLAQ
jgi:hypothetical protein